MACRMNSGKQSTRRTTRNRFPAAAISTERGDANVAPGARCLASMHGLREGRVKATKRGGLSMPDVGGIAGERLKSFIERVERLEEEKRALAEDIKEVYAEAKGVGFDVKIMRQIVKIRKMDQDDLDEQETLLDVYKRALGMIPDLPSEAAAAE